MSSGSSGCGCKEVYNYIIIASKASFLVCSMARILYIIIYISGRPYVVP